MTTFSKVKASWVAALAVAVLLGSAALAVTQQDQGRRVNSARQVEAAAAQTAAPETASEAQPEVRKAANAIFDTKFVHFDVSENAKRFIFDETPLHPDGAPAYGNEFITEGYIYPAGTLDGADGVNADGSPQFPDKVIGRWVCRGWHTGEGAKTVSGAWVATHQIYDLGAKPGQTMLVTDGLELVDIGVPVNRAISGGTGPFAAARGEATQTMLGFNQLNGVKLRFTIRVVTR